MIPSDMTYLTSKARMRRYREWKTLQKNLREELGREPSTTELAEARQRQREEQHGQS